MHENYQIKFDILYLMGARDNKGINVANYLGVSRQRIHQILVVLENNGWMERGKEKKKGAWKITPRGLKAIFQAQKQGWRVSQNDGAAALKVEV